MVASRPIALQGIPIGLSRASEAQQESMLAAAEQAIATGGPGLTASLALTVRSLVDEYGDLSAGTRPIIDAAEAEGRETVDLHVDAPLTMASAAETWLRLLEHLDDLASAGQFEHAPTSDDVRSYRRWLVDELVAQLRTARHPVPYAEAVRAR
jgi:hypothetical protein